MPAQPLEEPAECSEYVQSTLRADPHALGARALVVLRQPEQPNAQILPVDFVNVPQLPPRERSAVVYIAAIARKRTGRLVVFDIRDPRAQFLTDAVRTIQRTAVLLDCFRGGKPESIVADHRQNDLGVFLALERVTAIAPQESLLSS
jgi:hypothetical protein